MEGVKYDICNYSGLLIFLRNQKKRQT